MPDVSNEIISLFAGNGWNFGGTQENAGDGLCEGGRRSRRKSQHHVYRSSDFGQSPFSNAGSSHMGDSSSIKTSSIASPYSTQTTMSTPNFPMTTPNSSPISKLSSPPSDFEACEDEYLKLRKEALNDSNSANDEHPQRRQLILKLKVSIPGENMRNEAGGEEEEADGEEDSDYDGTINVKRRHSTGSNKGKKRKGGPANSNSGTPKRPRLSKSASGRTAPSPKNVQPQPQLGHTPGMQPSVEYITTPEGCEMAKLSRNLMTFSFSKDKPDPMGLPEVWADGRQALCETLPYYRAYQSSGYCTGGYACGFMFDKHSSVRDYMDIDVVLSLAGGGRSRDEAGSMVRNKDQALTKQIQDMKLNIQTKSAVALIVGDKNPNVPSKVPHAYCVMDWFKPTHIWSEKENGKTVLRYRFEKLKPDKESWWAPANQPEPLKVGCLQPPEECTCNVCQESSPQVYLQGWMCLNRGCKRFWMLPSGLEPVEEELLYDPRFLKQRTEWPHSTEPQPLIPQPMVLDEAAPTAGQAVSWVAWKGFVCTCCGRCNARESWSGWSCRNCKFEYEIPYAIIHPSAFRDYYSPLTSDFAPSRDIHAPEAELNLYFLHHYRIHIYRIPGVDGFVAHYMANKTVNEEPGGPDDMFVNLQAELNAGKIDLRRRMLSTTTLRGGQMTQHFCLNYGMYYKFVAQTASESFDTAPAAVRNTRSRLNWVARHALKLAQTPNDLLDFNEELLIGYFERQAIDYHDDGEAGLGPTIASISLGWPAPMKLRMKEKHHNGLTKSGNLVLDKPMPGCDKYAERLETWQELQDLKAAGEDAAYKQRVKELPRELGLKVRGNAKELVTLYLRHGDVMLMHGADIQKYFEHAVAPDGQLRFALTCRYIDPQSLPEDSRPEVGPDDGSYDGSKLQAPSK